MTRSLTIAQKLLRQAEVAFNNNRYSAHNAALSADNIPTITGYSASTFETPVGSPAVAPIDAFPRAYAAAEDGVMPWLFGGGEPVLDGGGLRFPAVTWDGQGRIPHSAFIDFITYGDTVVVGLEAGTSQYRFLVKEGGSFRYVSKSGIASPVSGSGKAYYKLEFPTRKHREIRIEQYVVGAYNGGSGRFWGVNVAEGDQIFRPKDAGQRLIFIGDSNGMAFNGPAPDSRIHVMAAHLGIDDVWISGNPGNGSLSWAGRNSDWLDFTRELVHFQVSWIDYSNGSGGIPFETSCANIMAQVDLVRETYPEAIIHVEGLIYSHTETATPDWRDLEALVKAAVEARDDNYLRWISTVEAYEGPMTGEDGSPATGNYPEMVAVPPGNDHWSAAGDVHIGIHLAHRYVESLEDMVANAPAEVVSGDGVVLLPDSATLQFEQDVERTQGLTVASDGTLAAVANVVPTLPAGLAVLIEDGALKLTGTPTTLTAAADYAITVELSGGGYRLFALNLEIVEEMIEFTLDMLYPTADMLHYAADNPANTVTSTLCYVLDDLSGNGRDAICQGPMSPFQTYETGVETLNGRGLLTTDAITHEGRFDMAALDLTNNVDGVTMYMLIRLDDPAPSPIGGSYIHLSNGDAGNSRAGLYGGEVSTNDLSLGGRRMSSTENYRSIRDSADREGIWQVICARIDYSAGQAVLRVNGNETAGGLVFDSGYGQTASTNSLSAILTSNLPARALAEVIIRKGYDSDTVAHKVEGRIARDWGVRGVLNSSHPYKNAVPLA